jgi:hypothetical protein
MTIKGSAHMGEVGRTPLKYETPRIEDHGDLAELTAGQQVGEELDASFPVHTKRSELTFTTP